VKSGSRIQSSFWRSVPHQFLRRLAFSSSFYRKRYSRCACLLSSSSSSSSCDLSSSSVPHLSQFSNKTEYVELLGLLAGHVSWACYFRIDLNIDINPKHFPVSLSLPYTGCNTAGAPTCDLAGAPFMNAHQQQASCWAKMGCRESVSAVRVQHRLRCLLAVKVTGRVKGTDPRWGLTWTTFPWPRMGRACSDPLQTFCVAEVHTR
jgi:hypothetical protein